MRKTASIHDLLLLIVHLPYDFLLHLLRHDLSLSKGGLIRGGAYMWTIFCVSEKVGLSEGEGGLGGGGLLRARGGLMCETLRCDYIKTTTSVLLSAKAQKCRTS